MSSNSPITRPSSSRYGAMNAASFAWSSCDDASTWRHKHSQETDDHTPFHQHLILYSSAQKAPEVVPQIARQKRRKDASSPRAPPITSRPPGRGPSNQHWKRNVQAPHGTGRTGRSLTPLRYATPLRARWRLLFLPLKNQRHAGTRRVHEEADGGS